MFKQLLFFNNLRAGLGVSKEFSVYPTLPFIGPFNIDCVNWCYCNISFSLCQKFSPYCLCQIFVGSFFCCQNLLVLGRPTLRVRKDYSGFKYASNSLILFD